MGSLTLVLKMVPQFSLRLGLKMVASGWAQESSLRLGLKMGSLRFGLKMCNPRLGLKVGSHRLGLKMGSLGWAQDG
ncbi:hypothetical protein RRG08_024249 [Elysia crispata]|uniref:Uncharacterized protein n=1 Tax=Elysia crispata TaxID=231223 RepID=A0AAE0Z3V5_9GAST|nr:hypothetical protein RRG08_024249 [Elysia crispata]